MLKGCDKVDCGDMQMCPGSCYGKIKSKHRTQADEARFCITEKILLNR